MAVEPEVEYFPKKRVTKAYVEREKNQRQMAGAIEVKINEDAENWILVTVWPAI